MKKLFGIIILSLLWSNYSNAEKVPISCEGSLSVKQIFPWETIVENNISTYKYNSLSKVPVELGNIYKTENYIPNISKANQLGLKSYIPLELQIEDSLNFHYSRNLL